MLCKIADLYWEVPEVGDLVSYCQEYRWEGEPDGPVYVMTEDRYTWDLWDGYELRFVHYMETGHQFGLELVKHNGVRLHSAAVAWNGRAYLFSAAPGVGKSTHRQMWQQLYGEEAAIAFNDDKPALRLLEDGKWYAYGTPWCGKNHINKNMRVPVAGICFIEQGPENKIRRMTPAECLSRILDQTLWQEHTQESMVSLLDSIDKLTKTIPFYLLSCTPTTDAAKLSSETMLQGALDAGL